MRWVIGDVHGMLRPLEALLRAVRRRDAEAHFYFTGDYCDRGPDTRGVVDLLIDLKAGGQATLVRGNHDDVFDLCLNRKSFASGQSMGGIASGETVVEAYELFWREGLRETLMSYGVKPGGRAPRAKEDGLADFVTAQFETVPEAHRKFFRELPGVAEADDFFVVHATWPCDYADESGRMATMLAGDPYLRYEAIWGRYAASQVRSVKAWARHGYVGHTPTDSYVGHTDLIEQPGDVVAGQKLTLVDTACFSPGGRLSAVCHDTGDVIQVHRSGEVLD